MKKIFSVEIKKRDVCVKFGSGHINLNTMQRLIIAVETGGGYFMLYPINYYFEDFR